MTETVIFKHFRNKSDINKGSEMIAKTAKKVFNELLSKMLRKNPFEATVTVKENPSITVCCKRVKHKGLINLYFGVARCSPNDTFYKADGRQYSLWRANYGASMSISLDPDTSEKEISNIIDFNANLLNKRFLPIESIRSLKEIPDNKKIVHPKPEIKKVKWTEEQIKKARLEAEAHKATAINESHA